jgi:hypothetical protein
MVIIQVYQGNFVADIVPIENKRKVTNDAFRIRVIQLHLVELLISSACWHVLSWICERRYRRNDTTSAVALAVL